MLRRSLLPNCRVCCRYAKSYARTYATEATHESKPSAYGQPLFQSHPHLVKSGELTPGIPSEEYEQRRRRLVDALPDNSVIISVAAPIKYMSANIFYKYRQASDFWYLTGFEEPDSAVIIEKCSSSRGYKMQLFSAGSDPSKAKWDGARTSHANAVSFFRAEEAHPANLFPSQLKSVIARADHVYVDLPSYSRRRPKSLLKYLSGYMKENDPVLDALSSIHKPRPLAPELAKLRAIKSPHEQQVMRVAADISAQAHTKTMRFAQPGMSEATLAAHFEYLCAREGAQRLAYVPVVASGANALIIHYTANNHIVSDGELVLVDAGCEYNGYASDITRTFPSSGKFTSPQAELYSALLSAQKYLITLCTESAGYSLHGLHAKSVDVLRSELSQLPGMGGLDRAQVESIYGHFLGHPVGIDLHESSNFDRSGGIKAGMVITIEPGVYIPPSSAFPAHYHNIGIRIEDEVVVGPEHPTVLSVSAPKEIVDIEGACQGLLGLQPF